jgi:hypothetical protein
MSTNSMIKISFVVGTYSILKTKQKSEAEPDKFDWVCAVFPVERDAESFYSHVDRIDFMLHKSFAKV